MSELMYKYQHAEHKQRNKDRNNNRNSITSDAEHQKYIRAAVKIGAEKSN